MNLTLRQAIAPILLLLSIAAPVAAGPLEDGNAAYKRGDYATAMRILRPLADQGDGMAEATVGLMYQHNFGVPLDFVTAYMWFSLGAAHGDSLAAFLLKRMTLKMTQQEIAEAQKRVRDWSPNMQQPMNTAATAETWSCDLKDKPYTQQWTISNGRMTAPHGKGYYRIAQNDDHVLMAFLKSENQSDNPPLFLIIIDKKTGNYFNIDTIVMSTMGESLRNNLGACPANWALHHAAALIAPPATPNIARPPVNSEPIASGDHPLGLWRQAGYRLPDQQSALEAVWPELSCASGSAASDSRPTSTASGFSSRAAVRSQRGEWLLAAHLAPSG
jgi:hypothetical protein